jgi:hypothetical protein
LHRGILLLIWVVAFCGNVHAQSGNAITLRLLDGKTGRPISATGILVRANHEPTQHGEWSKVNEDGTVTLNLPPVANVILVHATYENSMVYYINCDGPKAMSTPAELWYSVADIMTEGAVAPNGCVKPKDADKLKVVAKPGEFVLFVRPLNWRERSQE